MAEFNALEPVGCGFNYFIYDDAALFIIPGNVNSLKVLNGNTHNNK